MYQNKATERLEKVSQLEKEREQREGVVGQQRAFLELEREQSKSLQSKVEELEATIETEDQTL